MATLDTAAPNFGDESKVALVPSGKGFTILRLLCFCHVLSIVLFEHVTYSD